MMKQIENVETYQVRDIWNYDIQVIKGKNTTYNKNNGGIRSL